MFASRHVGEVKNRIEEGDYEEGESQAERIISALNRTESEWLPGYAETLRCFLPYVYMEDRKNTGEAELSSVSLSTAFGDAYGRLVSGGYIREHDGAPRLTRRGLMLVQHWPAVAQGLLGVSTLRLLREQRGPLALLSAYSVVAPQRLDRQTLEFAHEEQSFADRIAQQFARTSLRLMWFSLALGAAITVGTGVTVALGINVFPAVSFLALGLIFIWILRVPVDPRNALHAFKGLRDMANDGLRFCIAPSLAQTKREVEFALRFARFDEWPSGWQIDDGILLGMEKVFGLSSPVRRLMGVVVVDTEKLGLGSVRPGVAVIYPRVFAPKLRGVVDLRKAVPLVPKNGTGRV